MLRSLALTLLLVGAAATQDKPDFTGTWKQDNSKSTVRPGSTMQYSNKIEHRGPTLTVTTIMDFGDRPPTPYSRTYTTDGKPSKSSDREGDEFTTTVKWEGKTLVFQTGEKEKSGSITTREVWTLSGDGKVLTKKRHTSGPRGESDQTYVLEKQ
jgi:hypothetical protein